MKIAYLSTFYPYRGGIAQFNANLFEALNLQGHKVTPYTFTRQYPDFIFPGKTQYVTPEDNAHVIDSIRVLDSVNPISYITAAKRILRDKPDVLIMKYWMTYLAPSLGMVAHQLKKKGVKVITILDNVIPHEQKFFDKPFTQWYLNRNNGFVAMSESVLADLLTLKPDASYILKPHPLYNHFGDAIGKKEARIKLGIDQDKKTLLFFGLIRDYKGLDLLIEAVNQLDDSYQLLIAGETYGSFDKYEDQIKATGHPERYKVFNRYIDDNEVPAFFSAADVCVLPYKSATQSGITSIAFNFELPLIATRTGGLAENIEIPGAGLMVPEISAQSIANTVKEFYASDYTRFIHNIQREKAELTWEKFAAALTDFADTL